MYKLYDFLPSGNGYKVRLLLTQLQIPFELIELNILNKETRTPEFLQKNPNGKIPVLETAPEQFISESNAFVEDKYSIADIGLYAYTHVATEGGFDLIEISSE